MDFKDPQVQKTVVLVIFLAIVSYVYFFTQFMPFFFQPRKARIEALTMDYEKISADLEKARKTVGNLEKLEQEYERLHEKWTAAQSLLPQEKEVAELLRKVTRAGNQAGVDFMLFQPGPPINKEFIAENPVRVKIRGQYHQLGVFLSKVANLDRIINVSDIRITPVEKAQGPKDNKATRNYTIEAEMTMTAYTLLEGGEVSDAKQDASS
jgi:type IV pilus assembly protein PilO